MTDYGVVCNVLEADRVFRTGAKAWVVGGTGGAGDARFRFMAVSRAGRAVIKWAPTMRFHNFRAAWVPPPLQGCVSIVGGEAEMGAFAANLDRLARELREAHPNRRPTSPLPDDTEEMDADDDNAGGQFGMGA